MSFGQTVLLGVSGIATVLLFKWYSEPASLNPLGPGTGYYRWSYDPFMCQPPMCPECPPDYFRTWVSQGICDTIGARYSERGMPAVRPHCELGDTMFFPCAPKAKLVNKVVV